MKLKISRVFFLLLILAAFKLLLLGSMGVEKLTLTLAETVAPVVGVQEAQAQTEDQAPAEDQAPVEDQSSAKDQAQDEQEAATVDEAAAPMLTKPEGMDESDWKVLKAREEELAAKERTLRELEAQLEVQLAEIEKRNIQLRQLLSEAKNVKDERLQKLIKAYSNMKAKSAAAVLETMNPDLAVKILSGLGGRQAGEIMGFIETRKAAQLSEALTNLRIPFEE